jgi:hypothetical protein
MLSIRCDEDQFDWPCLGVTVGVVVDWPTWGAASGEMAAMAQLVRDDLSKAAESCDVLVRFAGALEARAWRLAWDGSEEPLLVAMPPTEMTVAEALEVIRSLGLPKAPKLTVDVLAREEGMTGAFEVYERERDITDTFASGSSDDIDLDRNILD